VHPRVHNERSKPEMGSPRHPSRDSAEMCNPAAQANLFDDLAAVTKFFRPVRISCSR
jgi:hypothetical protein